MNNPQAWKTGGAVAGLRTMQPAVCGTNDVRRGAALRRERKSRESEALRLSVLAAALGVLAAMIDLVSKVIDALTK